MNFFCGLTARAKHTLLGKPPINKDRDRRELHIEREPIFFMQSCGEVPCGSSQSYLMGAGGVRGVCHAGCGLCAPAARESLAGRDMRAYGAGEAAEPPTAQQTTPKSRSGISSKTT